MYSFLLEWMENYYETLVTRELKAIFSSEQKSELSQVMQEFQYYINFETYLC